MRFTMPILALIGAILLVASQSLYTVDQRQYAIKFHLRLPSAWNGKFFFEGGGGANGNLGNALGNLQGQQRTNALTLGYAVVILIFALSARRRRESPKTLAAVALAAFAVSARVRKRGWRRRSGWRVGPT